MSETAEALRAWVEADDELRAASNRYAEAQSHAKRGGFDRTVIAARDYLRGYDDAKAEMDPYIAQLERRNEELEMLLRESNDEIANAKARVRELEAQIAALAQALGEVG